MECRAASDLIHRYIDGEVNPMTAAEIDRHVAGCGTCQPLYDRYRALQRVVRRSAARYTAPPILIERIGAALDAAPVPSQPARRQWRAMALAASLFLTAGLSSTVTWIATNTGNPPDLTREIVASHIRSMMVDHLTDVTSSDQHTVKPWFDGRVDVAPPVRDFIDLGFPLVGGRLDYLGGRPVAALVYRHGRHIINLFVWPIREAKPGGVAKIQGYNLRHWDEGAVAYWAVSDLNDDDLAVFERLIRAQ